MALARIYTYHPEHAIALFRDLQRQGYEVEVLSPGETPGTPSDLEIQYEICDTQDALLLAQDLAREMQADVAVASGALPDTMTQPAPAPPLEAENVQAEWSGAQSQPAEHEAAILPQAHAGEPEQTHSHYAVEEPPANSEAEIEEVPAAVPVREHLSKAWTRAMTGALAGLASSTGAMRSLGASFLQRIREQRQRSAIKSAETRAIREEQLLELTCRRAEAERRSQQLEAARRAAAEYLSELHRASLANQHTSAQPHENQPEMVQQEEPRTERRQRTKAFAAAAAAAGVCFALALGFAGLRTRGSHSASSPAQSPQPAQTVRTPATKAAPPSRPSPSVRRLAHKTTATAPNHSSAAKPRHSTGNGDTDVADDVTIRHFTPAKPLQNRASNGVKHYSDIQN